MISMGTIYSGKGLQSMKESEDTYGLWNVLVQAASQNLCV